MVENLNNMNECEGGVPNGITPDCVSGMGDIRFPGEGCIQKGSGDIPLPSGRVYKQIQPFDAFIKQNYKKKKKLHKKKVSPDSPYYKHSPNPPVYKYVYDFKEYVNKVKEEL